MSDELNEEYEPDENDRENRSVSMKRGDIDRLEAKAKRADIAERKLAFAEAGISLTDPKTAYFLKGYDGELTGEAILAAATEAGFLAPAAQTEEVSSSGQAAGRVNAAAAGSAPPTNSAEKQKTYDEAFEYATRTGDWSRFNHAVSQHGSVVGINTP